MLFDVQAENPKIIEMRTDRPRDVIEFYKKYLDVNFVQDLNSFAATRYVASFGSLFFHLYVAGDGLKKERSGRFSVPDGVHICFVVPNLEERMASLGNLAQKQHDGSYFLVDPDSRLVHAVDCRS